MPGNSPCRAVRAAFWAIAIAISTSVVLISAWQVLTTAGVPPRSLGPYLERRASGHHPVIEHIGKKLHDALAWLDRGPTQVQLQVPMLPLLRIGAQSGIATQTASDRAILVSTPDEIRLALSVALPGDIIAIMPGHYVFKGQSPVIDRPGKQDARIILKAVQPGSVTLDFDLVEGLVVAAPYWTFENLTIRGVCDNHDRCEHAFHVTGTASHFVARNNVLTDFNAHFKINGVNGRYPDAGLIEFNTLTNTAVRKTGNPVTVVDLVGSSDWIIRRNLISDFIKEGSDRISYGAFAKGGGAGNLFEQNIVLCEHKLRGTVGQRVGLSLGGGGTGSQYCRDKRCITEQDHGIIRSNLIAFCSDDGIYINRSATSKVLQNTLIDTGGIVVRFPESTADVAGNLVDGAIRSRDDGLIREGNNLETPLPLLYSGLHPVRNLFVDALGLDLRWKTNAPGRTWSLPTSPDLCENAADNSAVYGAFRDFSKCFNSF